MAISAWTAFEDCRRALKCAIWQRNNRCVAGRDWVTLIPEEDPPDGFAANAQAWTATLRLAARILEGWGYVMSPLTLADGKATVDKRLNASVSLLFDRIASRREARVATNCDCGDCP